MAMAAKSLLSIAALGAAAACAPMPRSVDPYNAMEREEVGQSVLSLVWKFVIADLSEQASTQEFASPATKLGAGPSEDVLFVGSHDGWFYSLSARRGEVLWKRKLGSVSSRPTVEGFSIYVGSDDGTLFCLDLEGTVRWRYRTKGPILESPKVVGDLLIFANEADQVYALDAKTGSYRWQYKSETPDEFTLRGHAGISAEGDLLFTGFSNGTLVALRTNTGSVAWMTSLKGEGDRFVDVDSTPVINGSVVYASSSSGGLFAVDKTTGLIRWRNPIEGAGPLTLDEDRLYLAAANNGMYALDFEGRVIWRQGNHGGGEPARPLVSDDHLIYALSDGGVFVADKRTGVLSQFFDPGYGISARPTLARDRLFVVSNSAILYALTLRR